MAEFFDVRTLHDLCDAAINARLSRKSLLSTLDQRFVTTLHTASTPRDQLIQDLSTLNEIDALEDGKVPMRVWLLNAVHFAGLLSQGKVFKRALEELEKKLRAPPAHDRPEPTKPPGNEDGSTPRVQTPNLPARRPTVNGPLGPHTVRVFVSAAEIDRPLVEKLEVHLAPFFRSGEVDLWHRGMVADGEDEESVASAKLVAADLVLLFTSPDYGASNLTWEEGARAVKLSHDAGKRVVPVAVRPTVQANTPWTGLEGLPRSGAPLSTAPDEDTAYSKLAKSVDAIVKELRAARGGAPRPAS